MKTLIIKEVELTDEQHNDKCSNCCLNTMGDCRPAKSWLINSKGFKNCMLGYNYQEISE